MPIPPVGPPGITPPSDPRNRDSSKTERTVEGPRISNSSPEKTQPAETHKVRAKHVDISAETRHIRRRQTEITQLQIAEITAKSVRGDARDIKELVSNYAETARNGGRTSDLEKAIADKVDLMANRKESAKHENEILLDGREIKFELDNREIKVRTPDIAKEIEKFASQVKTAVRERDPQKVDSRLEAVQQFIDQAKEVRAELERDVRATIENTVRESSTSTPRDADHAERLIKEAAKSRPQQASQQTAGKPQIESKTINLLQ